MRSSLDFHNADAVKAPWYRDAQIVAGGWVVLVLLVLFLMDEKDSSESSFHEVDAAKSVLIWVGEAWERNLTRTLINSKARTKLQGLPEGLRDCIADSSSSIVLLADDGASLQSDGWKGASVCRRTRRDRCLLPSVENTVFPCPRPGGLSIVPRGYPFTRGCLASRGIKLGGGSKNETVQGISIVRIHDEIGH